MQLNLIAILVAALVPTVIGFIWYNPKVLGTAWMKAADMTEEKMKGANMGVIFGVSLVLSFLLAAFLNSIVVHQNNVYSILINEPGFGDPNSEIGMWLADFMAKYGNNFRTFQHGAFHGALAGLLLVLPVLGTNALFERKGFKYIAVNTGYWIVTLAIMGGIVCAWQ
ncbi:MAG: DUF1761 domain-containing protein [Saprospiraceae bacterium]|nr:DUF1761 domain-containing protein [Saprospiraceae bacterium]MCB0627055.1 DUF1761 domain-containing protein [Saprospiraceae bacterium]MCB0678456.1 DUF1761 domain-containing protein [Saprospiraceae bacterium]MCB0681178.1 DUF1761 domain-containing protein [Saprospiraceae bacterium]